jgi:CheY-like chemotaxis protein
MDVQMPVMDGLEATRRIRSDESSLRDIPIIALTANAMAGDISGCWEAGVSDFLPKPIDQEALLTTVARWTGRDALYAPRSIQAGRPARLG